MVCDCVTQDLEVYEVLYRVCIHDMIKKKKTQILDDLSIQGT